jgi:hypothetical protein
MTEEIASNNVNKLGLLIWIVAIAAAVYYLVRFIIQN